MGDCGRLILVSGGTGVVSMLMGEYRHNIDTKGRMIVPSKLREELGEEFVLTRGLDGCLFGYPMSEWQNLESKLNEMPLAKKDARTFVRFFYSAATECELDKQGRINIPSTLRNYAALTKECVVMAFQIELRYGMKNAGKNFPKLQKKTLMKLLKI